MKMKSGLLADLMALHKIRRKVETTHTEKIQVCINSHLGKQSMHAGHLEN